MKRRFNLIEGIYPYEKTFAAALLASSATLAVAPAMAAETATHHGMHAHHHHEHCLKGKCAAGEKAAQNNGDAETADLNAKSLAAAQNNQVPAIAGAAPAVTAPSAPALTAPGVSASGIPAPVAAGTGVKAPALPTAPTATVPTNAPLPTPVPVQ